MIYYKIPITYGEPCVIPVGAFLARSYVLGGFLWGEFYRVANVGNGWQETTQEVFDANRPARATQGGAAE